VRVLVVEDQEKTASFIRKGLVAESFAVDVAPDGETALSLATTAPFDAIILDIMLPGRDGLSVLRVLRERRVTPPSPPALHASHELKTPLTVMRGDAEQLLDKTPCTPEQREILTSHLDEIQRLARIVDNLGLLTKADAGLVTLERTPVPLHELVREAFDDAVVLGAKLGLNVELPESQPTLVSGDRHRLRQVLLNLVDNAVTYNRPRGSVALTLRRDGDRARLAITNSGPGIPPDQLPRVFDRFYRGDLARQIRADGSGLGLSIAQWIVHAHGGTIAMASEPGRQTTITIELPMPVTGTNTPGKSGPPEA